jgi:hypothetical protein
MAGEQHLHGKFVASRDALNQGFSSKEYSPAVAAITGAAAAAERGRIEE